MRLISQPAFAALAVSLAALGVTTALIFSPPQILLRHVAPLAWAEHKLSTAIGVEPPRYPTCLGTPPVTEAWQDLARSPDAGASFSRVLAAGSQAGRLYALAGLRATDPHAFRAALPGLLADTGSVPWRGPTGDWSQRRVAELAGEIAIGAVSAALSSALRTQPTCVE